MIYIPALLFINRMGGNVYVAWVSPQPSINLPTESEQEMKTEAVLYMTTKFPKETLFIPRIDRGHIEVLKNELGPEDDWFQYCYRFISLPFGKVSVKF